MAVLGAMSGAFRIQRTRFSGWLACTPAISGRALKALERRTDNAIRSGNARNAMADAAFDCGDHQSSFFRIGADDPALGRQGLFLARKPSLTASRPPLRFVAAADMALHVVSQEHSSLSLLLFCWRNGCRRRPVWSVRAFSGVDVGRLWALRSSRD